MRRTEHSQLPLTRTGPGELIALGAGLVLGWVAAGAVAGRGKTAVATGLPPAADWKHGVLWSTISAAKFSAAVPDPVLATAATLEELMEARRAVDASAKEAYGDAMARARADNDFALGHQATLINDTANAFDEYFARKATSLVGTDSAVLKGLSDKLKDEARRIPEATNALNQVNSFLTAFNQIVALVT